MTSPSGWQEYCIMWMNAEDHQNPRFMIISAPHTGLAAGDANLFMRPVPRWWARLSNALQIPLGSNFLTDLSTFKRLHFGMPYYTIFALILILLNLILFAHYLLNSTSSWKLTLFFIPILLSLSSLYWTDPLELWFGLFIPYPSSSIRSSAQLVLILPLFPSLPKSNS